MSATTGHRGGASLASIGVARSARSSPVGASHHIRAVLRDLGVLLIVWSLFMAALVIALPVAAWKTLRDIRRSPVNDIDRRARLAERLARLERELDEPNLPAARSKYLMNEVARIDGELEYLERIG